MKRIVGIVACIGTVLITGGLAQADPLPPAVRATCERGHLLKTLCADGGHYKLVNGHSVFVLNRGLTPTPPGRARESRLGWQYLNNQGAVGRCLSSYSPYGSGWTGLYVCNSSANQTWNVEFFGTNAWWLQNKGNGNCLNNRWASTSSGNVQITYTCNGAFNEHYQLRAQNGGFELRAAGGVQSNGVDFSSDQCVSSYGSYTDGIPAELASCNGSRNQTWGTV